MKHCGPQLHYVNLVGKIGLLTAVGILGSALDIVDLTAMRLQFITKSVLVILVLV